MEPLRQIRWLKISGCNNCKLPQAELTKTIPYFPNVQVERKIRPCSAHVKTLNELAERLYQLESRLAYTGIGSARRWFAAPDVVLSCRWQTRTRVPKSLPG
eukprot:647845-Rhodomonas_salina.2